LASCSLVDRLPPPGGLAGLSFPYLCISSDTAQLDPTDIHTATPWLLSVIARGASGANPTGAHEEENWRVAVVKDEAYERLLAALPDLETFSPGALDPEILRLVIGDLEEALHQLESPENEEEVEWWEDESWYLDAVHARQRLLARLTHWWQEGRVNSS
jgi:hypothetical protein